MIQVDRFDLILMDMMMPVMDGLEATRRLRGGDAGPEAALTPVVMLTANTLPEHVTQALEAGADAHLAKPVTPTALLQSVMLHLKNQTSHAFAA
ncbi:MAG: response regulator [Pseudomonas sp.]|uniref:response regulator n=1 Tax=Pseudomonas sp. TaxID=306 RepID=UPI001200B2D7|nr:response regulator [Pseudomonas sp.]RZI70688.1 MAG: response regulator [Pseudomonas sp.]